ncbi:MAG: hypothetical protein H0U71_03640 [Gammaproteobacteria bacterium]|nr:hypothetical protein [Gammaproteobacteria bacterium]
MLSKIVSSLSSVSSTVFKSAVGILAIQGNLLTSARPNQGDATDLLAMSPWNEGSTTIGTEMFA